MNTTPSTRATKHAKPITGSGFPICPECGQKDKVEKVSGIHGRGTRTETTSHSRGMTIAVKGTVLAQKLAPPALEPRYPDRGSLDVGLFIVSLIGTVGYAGMAWWRAYEYWEKYRQFITQVGVLGGWTSVQWIGIGTLVTLGCFILKKNEDRSYRDKVTQYEADYRDYEAKMAAWNNNYYCHRCDNTFQKTGGSVLERFTPVT